MSDITPEEARPEAVPPSAQPSLLATNPDEVLARIHRERLGRGLFVAVLVLLCLAPTSLVVFPLLLACYTVWPTVFLGGLVSLVARTAGGGRSRRFGIAGASLAVLGCVAAELVLPFAIVSRQADSSLPDLDA